MSPAKFVLTMSRLPSQIVVGRGDAHAGLRLAVGAVAPAGFDGDVLERAVVLVLIERAGGGIVGHVDIGPAVVVEVGDEHAQAVGAGGLQNAGFLGDIGERAVAVVVEENIFAAIQSPGGPHATIIPL